MVCIQKFIDVKEREVAGGQLRGEGKLSLIGKGQIQGNLIGAGLQENRLRSREV